MLAVRGGVSNMETVEATVEERLAQAEADVKALAQAVEKLLGVVRELKAAQELTQALMRQLLSGRTTSGN